MPLVNVALTGLLAYMGVGFARAHGLGRWWGLSLPVAVNAFMPPLHDLSDTAAMVALFALFWAWLRGGPAWGIALAGAAACLAREQNAAVVALILPAGLIARRPTTSFAATAALAVWAGWVLVVRQMYGQSPFIASNFDAPFDGLLFQFQHLGGNERFSTRKALFIIPMLALLLVEIGFAAYLAVRDRDGVVAGAVLGGVLLMCLVNDFVFRDFWSVTRIFVWIPLGVWILSVRAGKIWPIRIQMVAIMWPFAAALKYV